VVRNEVRSAVEAYLDNMTLTAENGDVALTALEDASILALAEGIASSSGGSAFGTGTSSR